MKKRIVALLAGVMLMVAASAMATTFNFSYSGAFNGSGKLEASLVSGNQYLATSGYTDIAGLGQYLLIPNPIAPGTATSPYNLFFFDDALTATIHPQLTNGGLLFGLGNAEFNIFNNGLGSTGVYYAMNGVQGGGYTAEGNVFFNAVAEAPAVPEPGTMMLLGAGMLGLAIYGKRRRNKEV